MTEELNTDGITEAVAAATSEEEFDALDFFSGAALPEDTVTVYQDSKTAFRLATLAQKKREQEELAKHEGIGLADEVEYIDDDEVEELHNRLVASGVTFELRGLAPAAKDALEKNLRARLPYKEGEDNPEYNEAFNATLIAKTIVSVKNAKGQTDKKAWDAERVLAFGKAAQPSEFDKLFMGAFRVNYIGDAIDAAVNADF